MSDGCQGTSRSRLCPQQQSAQQHSQGCAGGSSGGGGGGGGRNDSRWQCRGAIK